MTRAPAKRAKTATGTQVPGPLTKTKSGDAVQIRWTHAPKRFERRRHRAPKALADLARARDPRPARRRERFSRQLALGLGSTCCVRGRRDSVSGPYLSKSNSVMSRSISAVWPPLPRTTSVFIFFGSRAFVAVAAAARAAPLPAARSNGSVQHRLASQRWNQCIRQRQEVTMNNFRLVLWQLWAALCQKTASECLLSPGCLLESYWR